MNRAAAFSFALGSALAALSGGIAAPTMGDPSGEAQEALDLGVPSTSLSKTASVETTVIDKAALSTSALAAVLKPKPVPALWTFDYAKYCAQYDTYTSALAEL